MRRRNAVYIPIKTYTTTRAFFADAVITQHTMFDKVFAHVLDIQHPVKEIMRGAAPVDDLYAVGVMGKFNLQVSVQSCNQILCTNIIATVHTKYISIV